MSISFRILSRPGLVYVRYEGHLRLEDTERAFAEFARHPDRRPEHRQLIDLGAVTSFDNDFVKLMEVQAQKAATFMESQGETLLVYYTPTPLAQRLVSRIQRSWEPFPWVVASISRTQAEALQMLGLDHEGFDALLAEA